MHEMVRYVCYGDSHQRPPTGHAYLRLRGSQWEIAENHYSENAVTVTARGETPEIGGIRFYAMIGTFVKEWAVSQTRAIADERTRLSKVRPTHPFVRQGFRPVPASKKWAAFVGDTKREVAAIRADLDRISDRLLENGWVSERLAFVIPEFEFGDPWKRG